eukprot:Hpha_TRINITY_DN35351_c0_g1::TRINITY_DN35351_c0_g1_i1::g.85156::m.85156
MAKDDAAGVVLSAIRSVLPEGVLPRVQEDVRNQLGGHGRRVALFSWSHKRDGAGKRRRRTILPVRRKSVNLTRPEGGETTWEGVKALHRMWLDLVSSEPTNPGREELLGAGVAVVCCASSPAMVGVTGVCVGETTESYRIALRPSSNPSSSSCQVLTVRKAGTTVCINLGERWATLTGKVTRPDP